MSVVPNKYLEELPEIYRDILTAFPEIEPSRKVGEGLAIQTIFVRLRETPSGDSLRDYVEHARKQNWTFREIAEACQNMEKGGAVVIKQGIFVSPTSHGEDIIAALTGKSALPIAPVPPFPSFPGYSEIVPEDAGSKLDEQFLGEARVTHSPQS